MVRKEIIRNFVMQCGKSLSRLAKNALLAVQKIPKTSYLEIFLGNQNFYTLISCILSDPDPKRGKKKGLA